MATISLQRKITLSNEDAKTIEKTQPTKKYYELLENKTSARVTTNKKVPNWMRKK